MPIEKLRPSFSFDEERIKQLKQIVPEAFADNQINWEVLKEALGNYLEDDEGDVEHFGLFWPGKREARRIASIPSKGTLIPVYGEGLKPDGTPDTDGKNDSRNIFIEGENLEVLKILQKSYAGRIKMIYIDPPYNTGNDFVYDDDFTEPLEEYLRRTGQIDEEGKPLTTNKKSDGRFHSRWLSMMYPRLKLARNLLRDDGVIFVSIDDNEVHNLRQIMNEIFGEENFIGIICWYKKRKGSFLSKDLVSVTEYCLVYKKSELGYLFGGKPNESESQPLIKRTNSKKILRFPENFVRTKLKNGIYKAGIYGKGSSSVKLLNDIIIEDGIVKTSFEVEGPFVWSQRLLDDQIAEGAQIIINTINFQLRAFKVNKEDNHKGLSSFINGIEIGGTNEDAYELLLELFEGKKIFDYSKPINYLKFLIRAGTFFDPDSIILDFFAGSGSTGHAIYEYNQENNTNLNFILVQMKENLTNNLDALSMVLDDIAKIARERLRRASKGLEFNENDIGFRAFKVKPTHFKDFKEFFGGNEMMLIDFFDNLESSLVEYWQSPNLELEILLIEGFPLDSKIEDLSEFKLNKVQQVTSDFCEHKLLICLDKKVHSETIKDLQLGDTDIFICLDTAITDEEKVTLADKGLIKTI